RRPNRQAFLVQLCKLLRSAQPVSLVLTMRDEFYSRFGQFAPDLFQWLERGLANAPGMLDKHELADIISKPTEAVGLQLQPGLLDALVIDALKSARAAPESASALSPGGEAVSSTVLPLLEFALTRLWEEREEGMLTLESYARIGGVTGGLAQWADDTYWALGD